MKFDDVKKWKENFVSLVFFAFKFKFSFYKTGFLETEIKKEQLPLYDPEDNLDAPKPREMIDLEVKLIVFHRKIFLFLLRQYLINWITN